jgi:hypothetical protein
MDDSLEQFMAEAIQGSLRTARDLVETGT